MKKIIAILFVLFGPVLNAQWSGAGTAGNPYQIATPSDLAALASNVNAGNSYSGIYFKQMNDIDMNVSPYNTGTGWTPIGIMYSVYFTGIYQGDNRTISNLFINRPATSWIGLFACTNGTVTDLNFTNADVTGKDEVGVLAGYTGGTITNCTVSGDVTAVYTEGSGGGGSVGLLVGWNTGTVTNCHTSGTVSGNNNYVGGLTGYNSYGGDIVTCYSDAVITGPDVCGGLVGINKDSGSEVRDSYATGSVTSTSNYVGGLVGGNGSAILRCYATGAVSGVEHVGGLVGQVSGTVTDCYATGSVTATAFGAGDWGVGGLVGNLYYGGTISRCYATGNVSSANYAGGLVGFIDYDYAESFVNNCYARGTVSGYYAGGLVGYFGWGTVTKSYSTGSVTGTNPGGFAGKLESAAWGITVSCFWNTTSSGRTDGRFGGSISGLNGITTTGMKTLSTFTSAGWDFEVETANGTDNQWDFDIAGSINEGYPFLAWQNGATVTMPVELTSITATATGRGVLLRWTTATEVNNHGFAVERKELNQRMIGSLHQWKTVSFIEGHGTTNAPSEYFFLDKNLQGGKYMYRLKQEDRDGRFEYSPEVEVTLAAVPTELMLEQNYPNPFNPSTSIRYRLATGGMTTLAVYDALGREAAVLVRSVLEAGEHSVQFDASNLASGTYLLRLTNNGREQCRKISVLR
jgi:hypothetical protein